MLNSDTAEGTIGAAPAFPLVVGAGALEPNAAADAVAALIRPGDFAVALPSGLARVEPAGQFAAAGAALALHACICLGLLNYAPGGAAGGVGDLETPIEVVVEQAGEAGPDAAIAGAAASPAEPAVDQRAPTETAQSNPEKPAAAPEPPLVVARAADEPPPAAVQAAEVAAAVAEAIAPPLPAPPALVAPDKAAQAAREAAQTERVRERARERAEERERREAIARRAAEKAEARDAQERAAARAEAKRERARLAMLAPQGDAGSRGGVTHVARSPAPDKGGHFDAAAYRALIAGAVRAAVGSRCAQAAGARVVIALTISGSGAISGAAISSSSGNGAFDAASVAAVRRAGPFPPPTGRAGVSVPVGVACK